VYLGKGRQPGEEELDVESSSSEYEDLSRSHGARSLV
jgi:hypothetical protein